MYNVYAFSWSEFWKCFEMKLFLHKCEQRSLSIDWKNVDKCWGNWQQQWAAYLAIFSYQQAPLLCSPLTTPLLGSLPYPTLKNPTSPTLCSTVHGWARWLKKEWRWWLIWHSGPCQYIWSDDSKPEIRSTKLILICEVPQQKVQRNNQEHLMY